MLVEAVREAQYQWNQLSRGYRIAVPILLSALGVEIGLFVYDRVHNEPQRQVFKIEQYSPNVVMINRGRSFSYRDSEVKAIIENIDRKCHIAGNLPTTTGGMYELPITTQTVNCAALINQPA